VQAAGSTAARRATNPS